MDDQVVNYAGRTGGLKDLIGRRAMWGLKRVRIVGVTITEDGAFAEFVEVGKDKVRQRPVTEMRLVPLEDMPGHGNNVSDSMAGSECRDESTHEATKAEEKAAIRRQ